MKALPLRFGILPAQWGWPTIKKTSKGQYHYKYIKDPRRTYALVNASLTYLNQRHASAVGEYTWPGFSRSSTQCTAFAYLDKNEGNGYFALFIAASGSIGKNLPVIRELLLGKHGIKAISGQHFYLWCGKRDQSMVKMKCGSHKPSSNNCKALSIFSG